MRYRSNDSVPKRQKDACFEKDTLETSMLRSVQNELQDRAQQELWNKIPNAKSRPPRQSDGKDALMKVCDRIPPGTRRRRILPTLPTISPPWSGSRRLESGLA